VNAGSLEKDLLQKHGSATAEAMVESALRHVRILEDLDFTQIKISLKASDVIRTVRAYQILAEHVDYPFHAGITEAGSLIRGTVKSAAGLALILREGLADTIRVSLTAAPEEEVRVGYLILSSLGIRSRGPNVICLSKRFVSLRAHTKRIKKMSRFSISVETQQKFENLQDILKSMKKVLVAFSGGVDSTFLLKVAQDVLGSNVMAVIASSATYPEREQQEALRIAEDLMVKYKSCFLGLRK
jgi:hypothetical protein